jgi:DNA-binding transcriptional regulator YiaG
MKKKYWTEDCDNLVMLDYIRFLNVPLYSSEYGPVIDLRPNTLELLAAEAVLTKGIPIRGLEVKFLRKVAGFSLEKFANKLGLSSGTVFHWEKAAKDVLAPVNEAAVRAFIAETLNVEISAHFSKLVGHAEHKIELKAS